MNILFISENYDPYIEGGAEISTALLASNLASQNHEVSVICCKIADQNWIQERVRVYPLLHKHSIGTKKFKEIIKFALSIIFVPWISGFRALKKAREIKPDVINIVVTLYEFIPIIIILKLFTRIPIFIDCRDYSLICPAQFKNNEINDPLQHQHGYKCLSKSYKSANKFQALFTNVFALYESLVFNTYKSILRFMINHFNNLMLVPNSLYVQNQLVINGFKKKKTTVIYNISPEFVDTENIEKNPIATFAYAGRIEKEKGIWDIIHAGELLKSQISVSFQIKIAGSGSELERVSDYLNEKGIDYIKLVGRITPKEVLMLYKESLAILAPSIWPEPFGRFILESIATGVPVIATATGGTLEGIQNGVTGLIVAVKNPLKLAQAMKNFIVDLEFSTSMSKKILRQDSLYNTEFITNKRGILYKTLLKS